MAKSPSTLVWQTIDPATLSAPQRKQYDRYKESYREMKAERDAFEESVRSEANMPAGKKLAIGYNFGKLSFAIADDDGKPATSAKPSLSLGDWLKTQGGRRT